MQLIPCALAATIIGLILAPIYGFPLVPGWQIVSLSLLLSFLLHKYPRLVLALLVFVFFLVANLRYTVLLSPPEDVVRIDQLTGKVTLTGRVNDVRQLTDGRSRLDLSVESVSHKSKTVRINTSIAVRLYLETGTDRFLPGDLIRCKSRLRKPRLFGTPGEFNGSRYLASQRIDMTAWVKSSEQIELLSSQANAPGRMVSRWRRSLAKTLQSTLSETRAQLARALLLGEGKIIPAEVRTVLSKSGISHLFAISGLHLGLIALLSYRLLLSFYCRFPRLLEWHPPQRLLPVIIVPLLFVYLMFTGDAVSTRRAFAIVALGAIFLIWRYYVNPLKLLISLALLSLIVNPLLLWQAGWQLSFAGAAGIIVWRPWWQSKKISTLPVCLRYPVQLMLVSVAAMLTTLPLVLMNFHLVAPAGMLANFICVPIVTLCVVPAGLLGLLLFPVLPQLAEVIFQFCGGLLEFLLRFAEWFIAIPGFGGETLFLSCWQYLAVGVLVLSLFLQPQLQLVKKRMFVGILCLSGAVALWQLPLGSTVPVSLTMFSVGQGESLLLQNLQGQAVLIDGGGLYSPRFDVGERLLAPALGELKVDHLDAMVLTHDHPDHRKGLIYLLDNFPVRMFYSGHQLNDLHPSLTDALRRNAVPLANPGTGWSRLSFWEQGDLLIHNGSTPGFSENDQSLTMYLRVDQDEGLLLTGDLEQNGILRLLESGLPGPVSLLKIPHHGSKHSFTDRLVNQLNPGLCLVSVGYQNRYHLPAKKVVDDLHQRAIPLYRTDLSGTLRAQWEEKKWQIKHWEGGLFR
ncbi:MAG: DNA internalization-related competence protein ComEC/Rec2 [Deltaproteobacteria bacterium]|nr:DNA internalization-related competence protein ComEC/Rec2 [Deltaproteobacteria bacterium]